VGDPARDAASGAERPYVVVVAELLARPAGASVAGADRSVGLIMSKIGRAAVEPGPRRARHGARHRQGHDVFRAGEHDGADHAAQ
jgi:hypothetical protein